MARAEWQDDDIAEGLMQTVDGDVIGGTMSNLFLLLDGRLVTPSLDRCGVSGVMRRAVIESCDALAVSVEQRPVRLSELEPATEVFLTNSQFGIWPVTGCGSWHWPVGQVTRQLLGALFERGIREGYS